MSTAPTRIKPPSSRRPATKYVPDPCSQLEDWGITYHINRTVFHPIGLELILSPTDPGHGASQGSFLLVDHREVPGKVFNRKDLDRGRRRLEEFRKQVATRIMTHREAILGYVTQDEESEPSPAPAPARAREPELNGTAHTNGTTKATSGSRSNQATSGSRSNHSQPEASGAKKPSGSRKTSGEKFVNKVATAGPAPKVATAAKGAKKRR